jgi:hypothetical protein
MVDLMAAALTRRVGDTLVVAQQAGLTEDTNSPPKTVEQTINSRRSAKMIIKNRFSLVVLVSLLTTTFGVRIWQTTQSAKNRNSNNREKEQDSSRPVST